MPLCRGCHVRDASAKSHIVPKSFFRHMDDGVSPLTEYSTRSGHYPKRRRVGYYDTTILCHECEKIFGPHDDFGQNVLIKRMNDYEDIFDGSELKAYRMYNVDGEKFKRFLLSVLWRASISTLPQYSMVSLGPHEEVAKQILWDGLFGSNERFAFIGTKYIDDEVADITLNPHPLRNSGVNFISLYFPGYSFWIKVDRRPMPKPLNIIETNNLILLAQQMRGSKEYDVIKEAVRLTQRSI